MKKYIIGPFALITVLIILVMSAISGILKPSKYFILVFTVLLILTPLSFFSTAGFLIYLHFLNYTKEERGQIFSAGEFLGPLYILLFFELLAKLAELS